MSETRATANRIAANDIVGIPSALNAVLMMIAGYGPSLAALVVALVFGPRLGRGMGLRTWLARCLNWRIAWTWYALVFGLPPVVMITALGLQSLLGGPMFALVSVEHIPLAILNSSLVFLIGGPLGEELGWRGYALPALAAKMECRVGSLIIGVVWGLWHLPLFFMTASAQSYMPLAVLMLNIIAGSVVFAWLSEHIGQNVTSPHIGVIAENGIVTLTGHVENYAAKYAAEKAALRVWGVKGIAQDIEVRLPTHLKRADDEIAAAALHRLGWDGSLEANDIKVKVDKGWLTLSGVFDWHYQSEFAEQDVRRMQGVVGVINKITLKPRVNVANVTADIEHALHRSRFAPKTICVRGEDNKVVLTGTVHSWADKMTAGATVWAAPGAMNVQNNLMVA